MDCIEIIEDAWGMLKRASEDTMHLSVNCRLIDASIAEVISKRYGD